MRFRRVREEEVRIGIAPLIDIVFLLLIFFMVTSHFDVASGIRIRLPKVTKKIYNTATDKLNVIIDKQGQIFIKGERLEMKSLQKRLEELSKKKGPFHLFLQADKDVNHGRVVEIMDLAKRAGVNSILIAARWKADKVI